MKPEREFNELVDQKVMGQYYTLHQRMLLNNAVTDYIPPYSTDIAAAWQVVEKLRSDHHIIIEWDCGAEKYFCTIIKGNHDSIKTNEAQGVGETATVSICMAALKAVGVEVDD